MSPKKRGRSSSIPPEKKEKIALEYLTTSMSYREVAEKYGISKMQVYHSIVWHRQNELLAAATLPEMTSPNSLPTTDLIQENKRLKRQLQIARLKSEALESMLDVAENELKIDIRKKFGSRQPKFSKKNI